MNLRVMPLKVQNKQSFMGMNFSNPQRNIRYASQRDINSIEKEWQIGSYAKEISSKKSISLSPLHNDILFKGANSLILNNSNEIPTQAIAGYMLQKEIIRKSLIIPISLEKDYMRKYNEILNSKDSYTQEEIDEAKCKACSISIPSSILFYGCYGTGKTTFARAAAAKAGCFLDEYNFYVEPYENFINRALNNAKERYLKTGQRTAIIINGIEHYIDETSNDSNIRKNTILTRRALDDCSKIPNSSKDSNGSAVTFFFTTSDPKYMQRLIQVESARGEMIIVPIEPPIGDDLKEVLKFHIKRVMPSESSFDVDKYDFTSILDKLDPTREKDTDKAEKMGFYSNDRIRAALDEIRTAYDKNPEKSFKTYLEEMIIDGKSKRLQHKDISCEQYKKYRNYCENFRENI